MPTGPPVKDVVAAVVGIGHTCSHTPDVTPVGTYTRPSGPPVVHGKSHTGPVYNASVAVSTCAFGVRSSLNVHLDMSPFTGTVLLRGLTSLVATRAAVPIASNWCGVPDKPAVQWGNVSSVFPFDFTERSGFAIDTLSEYIEGSSCTGEAVCPSNPSAGISCYHE